MLTQSTHIPPNTHTHTHTNLQALENRISWSSSLLSRRPTCKPFPHQSHLSLQWPPVCLKLIISSTYLILCLTRYHLYATHALFSYVRTFNLCSSLSLSLSLSLTHTHTHTHTLTENAKYRPGVFISFNVTHSQRKAYMVFFSSHLSHTAICVEFIYWS